MYSLQHVFWRGAMALSLLVFGGIGAGVSQATRMSAQACPASQPAAWQAPAANDAAWREPAPSRDHSTPRICPDARDTAGAA